MTDYEKGRAGCGEGDDMTDLDKALAALRKERDENASVGHAPISWFLVDQAIAALDAAQGEAVWQYRATSQGQTWVDCRDEQIARTMKANGFEIRCLYAAPPAALAVPPERDWTMIQSGDASIPAWVVHYANAIGAYMKGQNVQHWAVGPVQSRNEAQQPAAVVPAGWVIERRADGLAVIAPNCDPGGIALAGPSGSLPRRLLYRLAEAMLAAERKGEQP